LRRIHSVPTRRSSDLQRVFHIGETIPLQLSFSSSVKNQYQVNMAQYDRAGRMNYERFSVSPAEGAVDPLPASYSGSMGGLTSFRDRKSTRLNCSHQII